jgi:hypothetical protein
LSTIDPQRLAGNDGEPEYRSSAVPGNFAAAGSVNRCVGAWHEDSEMALRILSIFVIATSATMGQRVESARPKPKCAWPTERLNPSKSNHPSQYAPLAREAEFAEDLAIRYADACCGLHSGDSGHFDGWAEYGQARDQCMATLFQFVARGHGTSVDQVRQSLADRPKLFDWAVILSYALLYGLAVYLLIDKLREEYWRKGERVRGVIITFYASVITSLVGTALSGLWSATMENIRLGNGHLSYRLARIPWQHNQAVILVFAMAVFWMIAVCRYRMVGCPKRGSEFMSA